MTRTIQILRGTTAQNNAFTGAAGELTMDTTRKELRVHDGSTVGGKVVSLTPGFIAPFAGSTAPDGWLVCDGSAVSRTTYADLFAVIGTTYGEGDGNSTFNLPDFTGRVPVYDSGSAIGSTSDGKLPNITGKFYVDGNNGPSNFSGAFSAGSGIYSYRNSNSNHATLATIQFNANNVSAVYTDGQTSVVPANVNCFWCIKY